MGWPPDLESYKEGVKNFDDDFLRVTLAFG
jgi:hypothetical protein